MSSRITSNMLSSTYLRDMRRNLGNMQTLQSQLSSGKEITKASDNPYKTSRSMQLYTEISYNKQYNENIKDISNWLDTTDTALAEMGNVFGRIETLLVNAGNGTYGDDEKSAIKDEIKEKVNELSQILNTSFDGSYIFGGTKTNSKPTTVVDGKLEYADKAGNGVGNSINISVYKKADGTITSGSMDNTDPANPINNTEYTLSTEDIEDLKSELKTTTNDSRKTEINDLLNKVNSVNQINSDLEVDISQGVKSTYNKNAVDILEFKDKNGKVINVSDLLNNIISDLGSDGNSSNLTTTHLSDIQSVTSNLLRQRSEVGSMQNRMESAKSSNETQNYNMTEILAKTEDIDFTEKIMEYAIMQTTYTAALQTSAKILPQTILNYL